MSRAPGGSATDTVSVADLVEDLNVYPRHAVDSGHVADLRRALMAGATLPPIIADRDSLRIVDGVHRYRAYRGTYGPQAQIPVVWETYADERELFERAVAANSAHGKKLDRIDQVRIALILERMQTPAARIAVALHVPEPRVEELLIRSVIVDDQKVPAKRSLEHLFGQTVTREQYQASRSGAATSILQQVKQLADLIRTDAYDHGERGVLVALHALADLIRSTVPRP